MQIAGGGDTEDKRGGGQTENTGLEVRVEDNVGGQEKEKGMKM
jgi:hypothetical protein